ncbi:MAG: riboflavin synthase [Gammaproteobacteria bacterium]|nr:riboflavin synthase [Gammaproteobacteria bacterium]
MFTGIIECVGKVSAITPTGPDSRLTIDAATLDRSDLRLGDSVAVNGVCLTVTALTNRGFSADISRESLSLTTHGALKPGDRVNLEKALTLQSRLGGHLVSGHVDGIGRVTTLEQVGFSQRIEIEAPSALLRYIAAKGSIAVDGISLTVNRLQGARFELNIIPHTLAGTTLDSLRVGMMVNLEVDQIARYVERLMQGEGAGHRDALSAKLSPSLLAEHGYL